MTSNPNRPDYSRLSLAMQAALDLLEDCWEEYDNAVDDKVDAKDAEALAWTYWIHSGTYNALRNRGFAITRKRCGQHGGYMFRMANPPKNGLFHE